MSTMTQPTLADTHHVVVATTLGELTLVGTEAAVTGLYFPGHWTDPDRAAWGRRSAAPEGCLADAVEQLGEYLAGSRRGFDVPLEPHGTPRARELWHLLRGTPYGQTTTYGALAARLGGGISARAVGGFVGHNPVSILIPCHRVVGSTGRLTGYAGGLERKQHLLELEGALPGSTAPLW